MENEVTENEIKNEIKVQTKYWHECPHCSGRHNTKRKWNEVIESKNINRKWSKGNEIKNGIKVNKNLVWVFTLQSSTQNKNK